MANPVSRKEKRKGSIAFANKREILDRQYHIYGCKADDYKGPSSIRALQSRMDSELNVVGDRMLTRYVNRLYKAEHVANSFAIYCKLTREKFSPDLLNRRWLLRWERSVMESLRRAQSKVNERIAFLKKGDDLD